MNMQGESSKGKRKRKRNNFRPSLNLSKESASYFFFTGLLIIAIFGCVASGAPKQGFYGLIFLSIGILVAVFPPVFVPPKWLIIASTLLLISLSFSLLPRTFASIQSWRINLESIGLDTGNLISPHPATTVESLIIVGVILMIGLCSLGHRIGRDSLLKVAALFVLAVSLYTGISMLFVQNEWDWAWDPNNQFGFFANRNHMATLMVMASLVGVGSLFIYLKKRNWPAFIVMLLATAIICWAILGYSVSRAGLILFISFQLLWFSFVFKKHLNYKLVTSFLVLFSLAVILFFLSDTKLEDRVQKLLNEKENNSKTINTDNKGAHSRILGIRKYIHSDTYEMIRSEPWTGTGLGNFEFIFPFYQKKSGTFSERIVYSRVLHPESNWLDLASQAGFLPAIIVLYIIFSILFRVLLINKKSRSWLLSLSCILAIFCILIHGIFDVPGQKIGIVLSGILLIGITHKYNNKGDKPIPRYAAFIYQSLAIGIFSLGLMLIHSQWFSSESIIFSDSQVRMNKIQNLYKLSIDSAQKKDFTNQKRYIISAINLVEKAIERTPIDPDLHFTRGKLYSLLDGNEDKIRFCFNIESTLDPAWPYLLLRQAQVWLFIDIDETRRLWTGALERANNASREHYNYIWDKILDQARQHPIHISDTYKFIISRDDSSYIMRWMNYAGNKNLKIQIPKILCNNLLRDETKNDILVHWGNISPNDYDEYLKSKSLD